MSRSRFWICPSLFVLPLSVALSARADEMPPTPTFWRENTLASPTLPGTLNAPTTVSRAQFFGAASGQIGFLGAMQSWRDTLRGGGSKARRKLWNRSVAGGRMALSLGGVNAPGFAGFGASAGTSLSWNGASGALLEAGTTARPPQLDEALARFDQETTDAKAPLTPLDRANLTWLRARPLSNKNGEIEAIFLRAARDGKAGEGEQWTSGDFETLNARLVLPSKWMLRGTWTGAHMEAREATSSWNTSLAGPLTHPWGQANVALDLRSTDPGFSTFAGQNGSGEQGGNAQITQQIQTSLVSGQLSANASTSGRPLLEGIGAGTEIARESERANADLKLQLLRGLNIKATGNVSNTQVERAMGAPSTENVATPTTREAVAGTGGDVGVELKMSKALSVEAGAGLTQNTLVANAGEPLENRENRATFRLRHQTGGGSWSASLQARDRTTPGTQDTTAPWTRVANVGLEGERRLIGDFRLRANMNWLFDRQAQSGDAAGVARVAGAQLSFSKAARLDLRYRDGAALPSDLRNDPLGALFLPTPGSREVATRFNLGAAAGGKGFGMALEWARQGATSAPNDSWKIGLTYR